ncbi:hypothetical protein SUGI_0339670 [Cryptomeria japonica]|nr:hypothetical protein SUGI_0339670 [Cryptomeria japonica]
MQIEVQQLCAKIDALKVERDCVRGELEALQQRQMQTEVQQLCAKIDALKVERDCVRGELEALQQRMDALTMENASLREALGRAEGRLEGFILAQRSM